MQADATTDLRLYPDQSVFVEYLGTSGFAKLAGIDFFVFYEDHDKAAMLVRVLDKHPTCRDAEVGAVYVTKVYRDRDFDFKEKRYRVMSEKFLECKIEGYDDESEALYDDHESDGFPVCAKA